MTKRRSGWLHAATALNLLVLGGLVGLTSYFLSVTVWFDRDIALEDKLNSSMDGRRLPAPPQRISLAFQPGDGARSLYVVLGYAGMTSEFAAIRLSAIEGLPTAFVRFADGWPTEITPLDDPAASPDADRTRLRSLEATWTQDRLRARVNGGVPLEVALPRAGSRIDFAVYPSQLIQWPWPQLAALRSLEVEVRGPTGDPMAVSLPSAACRVLWTLAGIAAFVLAYVAGDCLLSRLFSGAFPLSAFLRTYPAWPVLFLLALPFLGAIHEHTRRHALSNTWFSGLVADGRFDTEAFLRAPVLERSGNRVEIDLDPSLVTVMAFGGSTTHGFPYERGTWDWPTQLQRLLDAETARGEPRFQVVNLGFAGNYLDMNFPPFARSFLEAVRPDVIVLNVLINDYFQQRGITNIRYLLGSWRHRTRDRPGTREDYAARLGRVIAMCQGVGARVVVVEPPVDRYFFEGNPLADWQRTLGAVAAERGAAFVPLQAEFDGLEQRFVFHEFMHPTRLGYGRMAERIREAIAALGPFDAPPSGPSAAAR